MRSTTTRANHRRSALFELLQRCPLTAWQMAEAAQMKAPVVENFIAEHIREKRIEVVGQGERKPGVVKGYKPKTYRAVDGAGVILLTGAARLDDDSAHRRPFERTPVPLEDAWFDRERERCFLF